MDKHTYHKKLTDSVHETYLKKDTDYGSSFAESFKEFGIISAMVRIGDKYNRAKNIAKKGENLVKDESIRDTLMDMAGYCIMTVQELDMQKQVADNKAFEESLCQAVAVDCSNEEPEELPFTPDEEDEEEELLDNVIEVSGDGEYEVEEKYLEKFGAKKIASMIALRNAGWSQDKIADEFNTQQSIVSVLFRKGIKKVG